MGEKVTANLMSYQVLARKWRPARFQEMVGQEHVLKALVNALDDDRLHHAYLFTGTRGVGKTSIARLFAKSLNCEQGVSSTPCGICSACKEIAEGRFVDLIEVDAASRTKVEDTRELMENVQYAPTHGRYKVYLIDEVHMLSTHSFNALLKTLEEPPPHVKFLLATTDPQKLPITILSRCLQFNLKNLIPERIVQHLIHVLSEEQIKFEESALWLLARSADGSMRDAMSLTDQAIAFGAGEINEADVRAMLGTIDQRLVYQMLDCLAASDAKALMTAVNDLAQFSPDYNTVLGDLISVLHRIAVAQAIPDAVDNSMGDQAQIISLSQQLSAEDVQLYYQVALMGRKDLPFVPDPREGLEMVLLRMLAFRPASAQPREQRVLANGATAQAISSPEAPVAQSAAPIEQSTAATEKAQPTESSQPEHSQAPAAPEANVPSQHVPASQASPVPAGPVVVADNPAFVPSEPVTAAPPSSPEVTPGKKSEAVVSGAGDLPPWEDVPDYDQSYTESSMPVYPEEPAPVSEGYPATSTSVGYPATNTSVEVPALPEAGGFEVAKTDVAVEPCPKDVTQIQIEHWVHLSRSIGLTGMTESLATHLSLESVNSGEFLLHYTVDQRTMLNEVQQQRITDALNDYFGAPVQVQFAQGEQHKETPAQYMSRKREERHALAISVIREDETVQMLQKEFDAQIELSSVMPID